MIAIGYKMAGAVLRRLRRSAEPILELILGSDDFTCPVCGRGVHHFRPLPSYYQKNLQDAGWPYPLDQAETCNTRHYSCPHCFASDRDRLCVLYLDAYLAPGGGPKTLVQFAPSAPLSRWIQRTIDQRQLLLTYRTADLYAEGVDDRLDITDMKAYADGSLDFFICSHVLEHVREDRKALRELFRVLRPAGCGILLVPIVRGVEEIDEDPEVTDLRERWRRFGQDDHVRLYSKRDFLERVREAGFVVNELDARHFGPETFERNGIAPRSVLYLAERPALGND
ncbi:MAG TPA: methyltransferase domain-containing protein [Gemmataceae bacterium]|nr:methyltransferase domain-containing protein [Gemmataceae bacterium]